MKFDKYRFRCSGLKNLMVSSRSKSDPLSETTKAYLRELWIEEVYGRKKTITSKYMEKGTIVESDSLDLVQEALEKTYFKNQEQLGNDWITGTPDVVSPDLVDIKSCWDIWSFASKDEKTARKDYYYQLLGYMWLTGKNQSDLIYTLTNTPEHIISDELYRLSFTDSEVGSSDEYDNKIRQNYIFDDIDKPLRVKRYIFELENNELEKLKEKIILSREYMKGLSL